MKLNKQAEYVTKLLQFLDIWRCSLTPISLITTSSALAPFAATLQFSMTSLPLQLLCCVLFTLAAANVWDMRGTAFSTGHDTAVSRQWMPVTAIKRLNTNFVYIFV